MRDLKGKLRWEMWLLAVALLGCGRVRAQIQEPPTLPTAPGQNTGRVPFGQGQEDDPILRHAQSEAARRQNADRQKKMVSDTDKILHLAQELKAAVDKGDKDSLSTNNAKKVEEIEKLARSVKDRMRMD